MTFIKLISLSVLGFTTTESFAAENWTERFSLFGDARLRHEFIDERGKNPRNRQRLKATLGTDVKATPVLNVGLALSTGGTDPISTNQTLDEGFTRKTFGLDLAYLKYVPRIALKTVVTGGKMKNPFYVPGKSEMIWDHDLRPEGFAGEVDLPAAVFAKGGAFWADESETDDDIWLLGAQLGWKLTLPNQHTLTVGGSNYTYTNIVGRPTLVTTASGTGNTTNSTTSATTGVTTTSYKTGFLIWEGFVEYGLSINGVPAAVFADAAKNVQGDKTKYAWLAGFWAGGKDPGAVVVRYNFRRVDANAVVGAFTDSDFKGGGSGGWGHEGGADYVLSPVVKLGGSLFLNSKSYGGSIGYSRAQLDLSVTL